MYQINYDETPKWQFEKGSRSSLAIAETMKLLAR